MNANKLHEKRLEALCAHTERGWQDSEHGCLVAPEIVADEILAKSVQRCKQRG